MNQKEKTVVNYCTAKLVIVCFPKGSIEGQQAYSMNYYNNQNIVNPLLTINKIKFRQDPHSVNKKMKVHKILLTCSNNAYHPACIYTEFHG